MPADPSAITAVVPLRAGGKTRLGGVMEPERRAALAGAMLADVAAALQAAGVGRIVVAASGAAAVGAAGALDLDVVADGPEVTGLDQALRHAAGRLGVRGPLLVVAADLPRLTAGDLRAMIDPEAAVVIAPTDDGGTGGLLRRPADAIPTAYGPRSASRHRHLARAAGLSTAWVDTAGFRHDVDTAHDLRRLLDAPVGRATSRVLDAPGAA